MRTCLDAGHGLPDPGAVGRVYGTQEQKVTLNAALFLKCELEKRGHQVTMTRFSEQALDHKKAADLAKRCRISNEAGVDCFVSIHCNSVADPAACGWEIIHDQQSTRGKFLAECILAAVQQADLVRSPGETPISSPDELRNRGTKAAELYVLNNTKAPAVLVELAFISNPREEELLRDPDWLQSMAVAMATGIDMWGRQNG